MFRAAAISIIVRAAAAEATYRTFFKRDIIFFLFFRTSVARVGESLKIYQIIMYIKHDSCVLLCVVRDCIYSSVKYYIIYRTTLGIARHTTTVAAVY